MQNKNKKRNYFYEIWIKILIFIHSLFIIDKNKKVNVFFLQAIIGLFNFISFYVFVIIFIVFRNNLNTYLPIIVCILYGLFLFVNIWFSLYFYFYLRYSFSKKQKKYFLSSIILGIFGINLFISLHFYLKSGISNEQKTNSNISISKEDKFKLNFINSLFIINRINRAKAFLLQTIIGLFNFILFFIIMIILIIFRSNLTIYSAIIVYAIYSFYIFLNVGISLYFYFSLNSLLNNKEKNYFLFSIILAIFGLNLFTSLHFYLKSGISDKQRKKALWIINKNKIKEILNLDMVKNKLNKKELLKINTLLEIAKNKHESHNNVNSYILKFLLSKNIKWDIEIDDKEIVQLGVNL